MLRMLSIIALTASSLSAALPAKPTVDYNSKIKPIFSKHCYECHNDKKDKGGFAFDKLDRLATNIGRGRIIVPGSVEDSDIIDIVQGTNGKKKMPPKDKGSLSTKEIESLRVWIKEGAQVPGLAVDKNLVSKSNDAGPQMLSWTNVDGKTLRATFEGRVKDTTGDFVMLKLENGKVFKYPMNQLNAAGQSQAKIQELRQR